MSEDDFTMEDFHSQLVQLAKSGLLKKMIEEMSGIDEINKKDMKRLIGIINSMTPRERKDPSIINRSQRIRIATGSGVPTNQVFDLVKQFEAMKQIMFGLTG